MNPAYKMKCIHSPSNQFKTELYTPSSIHGSVEHSLVFVKWIVLNEIGWKSCLNYFCKMQLPLNSKQTHKD